MSMAGDGLADDAEIERMAAALHANPEGMMRDKSFQAWLRNNIVPITDWRKRRDEAQRRPKEATDYNISG